MNTHQMEPYVCVNAIVCRWVCSIITSFGGWRRRNQNTVPPLQHPPHIRDGFVHTPWMCCLFLCSIHVLEGCVLPSSILPNPAIPFGRSISLETMSRLRSSFIERSSLSRRFLLVVTLLTIILCLMYLPLTSHGSPIIPIIVHTFLPDSESPTPPTTPSPPSPAADATGVANHHITSIPISTTTVTNANTHIDNVSKTPNEDQAKQPTQALTTTNSTSTATDVTASSSVTDTTTVDDPTTIVEPRPHVVGHTNWVLVVMIAISIVCTFLLTGAWCVYTRSAERVKREFIRFQNDWTTWQLPIANENDVEEIGMMSTRHVTSSTQLQRGEYQPIGMGNV